MTPTLHFIYGNPGAGKTSLARELAERTPAVLFVEDEWLLGLGGTITSVEDFMAASRRVRALIKPLATRILTLGTSVVFDFAANTVNCRTWVRSIFEAAGADHLLHVLDVPLDECKRRVRARNEARPAGLYFGDVSEALVDQVVPYIVPPAPAEGFRVTTVRAPTPPAR